MPSFLLCLTCPLGLESIAKKEIEILGYQIESVTDKAVFFHGGYEAIAKANLWSRVGNKVYIVLSKNIKVTNFDHLYAHLTSLEWKKYIFENPVIVHAVSQNSGLNSLPTIQKISKKAIVDSLVSAPGDFLRENAKKQEIHIDIVVIKDSLLVLLDTSGVGLHKRGYRLTAQDAPIRENLAAGIILLSGWKFRQAFYDIFCGSGTIPIEAAMIAKNIAPGLKRNFDFERFDFFPATVLPEVKKEALTKIYEGQYAIFGSDMDEKSITIAKKNALNAGVSECVSFEVKDVFDIQQLEGTLVSNPPYGERLNPKDLQLIYKKIHELFENQKLRGGIITSYDFDNGKQNKWKRRKLFNGGLQTNFYKKIDF